MKNISKEHTEKLGVYLNFFYIMKNKQKDKYSYIEDINYDALISYPKYLQRLSDLTEKCSTMIYDLEDSKDLLNFGKWLVKLGVYTNIRSIYQFRKSIFSIEGIKDHKTYLRSKKILAAYEQFRKE